MTIGQRLKAVREAQGLTQIAAARLVGMPQSTVSRIESGQILDAEAIARLELGLTGERTAQPEAGPSSLAAIFNPVRPRWVADLPRIPLDVRLNQARMAFGRDWVNTLVSRLRQMPDGDVLLGILATLNLDSSFECVFVARLLVEGWRFERASPLGLGCRWYVRDRQSSHYIGDAPRWVIHYPGPECQIALIPQVTVVAQDPYRLDFPGVAARGDRRAELLVEVDGPQHTREKDQERTLDVDLPTHRITQADLRSRPQLTRDLVTFAAPLCQSRPRTVRRWQ